MITDEKIKEGLNEAYKKIGENAYFGNGFKAGVKFALKEMKNSSTLDDSKRRGMREEAIAVFELTKGFTGEPTDDAMKTALEMAKYVLELTNNLD